MMKKLKKNIKIHRISGDFLRTCPVCGFTFRSFKFRSGKKVKTCPMCGHKFIEPNVLPRKPKDFDGKYF